MNSASAASLTTTMMLFAAPLSLAPRSSSQVISHHDAERRQVDEDRDAGDVRRGIEQPVHVGVRAEERGAIAGRQPDGQRDADAAHQRREVVAPRDGDGDVADRVLEDQVPADDPRDELAERRVRVGVGAAGLRNHRGELRVAERRERARATEQQEREDERRPRAVPHDVAGRVDLAGRRRADGPEDAGADHGADREHDEVAGAQDAPQPAFPFREQLADGFSLEDLQHQIGSGLKAQGSGAAQAQGSGLRQNLRVHL